MLAGHGPGRRQPGRTGDGTGGSGPAMIGRSSAVGRVRRGRSCRDPGAHPPLGSESPLPDEGQRHVAHRGGRPGRQPPGMATRIAVPAAITWGSSGLRSDTLGAPEQAQPVRSRGPPAPRHPRSADDRPTRSHRPGESARRLGLPGRRAVTLMPAAGDPGPLKIGRRSRLPLAGDHYGSLSMMSACHGRAHAAACGHQSQIQA